MCSQRSSPVAPLRSSEAIRGSSEGASVDGPALDAHYPAVHSIIRMRASQRSALTLSLSMTLPFPIVCDPAKVIGGGHGRAWRESLRLHGR